MKKSLQITHNDLVFELPLPEKRGSREGDGWRALRNWKREFKKLNPSIFAFSKTERKDIYNKALSLFGLKRLEWILKKSSLRELLLYFKNKFAKN